MFNIIHRNTRSLSRIELRDEQILVQAPSVSAATTQARVSERYAFLPTVQILAGRPHPIQICTASGLNGVCSATVLIRELCTVAGIVSPQG